MPRNTGEVAAPNPMRTMASVVSVMPSEPGRDGHHRHHVGDPERHEHPQRRHLGAEGHEEHPQRGRVGEPVEHRPARRAHDGAGIGPQLVEPPARRGDALRRMLATDAQPIGDGDQHTGRGVAPAVEAPQDDRHDAEEDQSEPAGEVEAGFQRGRDAVEWCRDQHRRPQQHLEHQRRADGLDTHGEGDVAPAEALANQQLVGDGGTCGHPEGRNPVDADGADDHAELAGELGAPGPGQEIAGDLRIGQQRRDTQRRAERDRAVARRRRCAAGPVRCHRRAGRPASRPRQRALPPGQRE